MSAPNATTSCIAPDCDKAVYRGGACQKHHSHLRRHGDLAQVPVSEGDLRPYRYLVRVALADHGGEELRQSCLEHWRYAVQDSQEVLAHRAVGNRFKPGAIKAARIVLEIAGDVAPDEIVETVIAFGAMYHDKPHRFASTKSMGCELVRRVRGLSRSQKVTYGGVQVLRELHLNSVKALAETIAPGLVATGIIIMARALAERDRRAGRQPSEAWRAFVEAVETRGTAAA